MSYVPSGQSDFKKPVRVATTANLDLASPGASVDGVTLAAGDRVLVKNQTTGSQNGIYLFAGSASAMTRANDAEAAGELDSGTLVVVAEGSTNADTVWIVSTNGTITIGSTSIAFSQVSGGGSSSASGVSYGGSTNLSASDVEAALDELDAEKASVTQLDAKLDASMLPAGMIAPYAGTTAPTGWLLCDGSTVSRSTYAALFAAIGTSFGSGDGTTFGLPDLRGRVPVGLDNLGGSDAARLSAANTLGDSGGSENHTLTSSEMPSHTHGIGTLAAAGQQVNTSANGTGSSAIRSNSNSGSFSQAINFSGSLANTGGDGAHNNMQPYLLLGYIIKT